MKIEYLRASSINTWRDCQFKYFLTSVCEIPTDNTLSTTLGTIVHHVLEILAKCKKNNHHLLKDKYSDYRYLTNIIYKRYVLENPHIKFSDKDYKFCITSVEKVLDSIFNPLKLNILKTEQQFHIDIKRKGFHNKALRGTIDLITEEDSETLHIIDYKTGKHRSDWATLEEKNTVEDFKKDPQLQLYDVVASVLYPKYKYILLTIIFINAGGPFTVSFEPQERKSFIEWVRKLNIEIEQCNKPDRLKDDKTKSKLHFKCKYVCGFGKYEVYYANSTGKIKKLFSYKELAQLPKTIEENGMEYHITDDDIYSTCDKYYGIMKKAHDLDEAKQTIVQLTMDPKLKISRRNNYSHENISKGTLS